MKFDFLKTPTNIACLVIAIAFFLPFTPYLSISDNDGENKISITGIQMLLGSVSISADDDLPKGAKDQVEEAMYDGIEIPGPIKNQLQPVFGLIDKLGVVLLLSALMILFVSYKMSIGESSPVGDETMRWVKITLVTVGTLLMFRYLMIPLMVFPINAIWSVGLGAFLTMMSIVVIYFDNKLK